MVIKPIKFQRSKQGSKNYVGRSKTVYNVLLCAHTLWLNYVTKTFLLVSYSDTTQNQLCLVHDQGQKSEQKYETIELAGFIAIWPFINFGILTWHKRKHVSPLPVFVALTFPRILSVMGKKFVRKRYYKCSGKPK